MLEAEVLDLLLKALIPLQSQGGFFWRNNTGAVEMENRYVRFGLPGAADVLGVYKGFAVAIECKRSSVSKLSPDQEIWRARWLQAGGVYYMVNNLEAIQRAVNSLLAVDIMTTA